MATFLTHLLAVLGVMCILPIGILSAFWPINDEPTSSAHKVITLALTALFSYVWLSMFKF